MQRKYADPPPQFAYIGRWCGFFMSLRGVALDDSYSLRSDYSNIIKLHRDIVFFKKDSEIKSLIDEIINYAGKVNEDVSSLCYLQVNSDLTFQQKSKLATVFEPDDCSLQMLIKKCRKLQSRLGVHFKSPDFLDISNS